MLFILLYSLNLVVIILYCKCVSLCHFQSPYAQSAIYLKKLQSYAAYEYVLALLKFGHREVMAEILVETLLQMKKNNDHTVKILHSKIVRSCFTVPETWLCNN